MGDYIKNIEMFKKLGFKTSDQWILYEESWQNFFSWFAENINIDNNILTETEIQEASDLKESGEFLSGDELDSQLESLNNTFPFVLDWSEADVTQLETEINHLTQAEEMYADLIKNMEHTTKFLNQQLTALECENNEFDNQEINIYSNTVDKAKRLQEIQKENFMGCAELNESFAKVQTPPLFIHQLPLDQYCQKCDSFLQYLTIYMKENFNILNNINFDEMTESEPKEIEQLRRIQTLIFGVKNNYVKNKMKSSGLLQMIADLDINYIHHTSLLQLKKETHDLKIMNQRNSDILQNTLMIHLNNHLKEISQQQIEIILYENSKQKFERARQRLANSKYHSKLVSDALSNAELLWILMQFDLEKVKNKFNNSDQLLKDSQKCMKRIEGMKIKQSLSLNPLRELFSNKMSEKLSVGHMFNSPKSCLFEYEKFCRSSKYLCKNIIDKKYYNNIKDSVEVLDSINVVLLPYVFNAPINRPMLENMKYLKPVFEVKNNKKSIEKIFKNLRKQFKEDIWDKINADRLWRHKQNLWIWFLTEPKKVLNAIDEASKTAAKIPAVSIKPLSGIKRK